jgi:hypothetical protein
MAIKTKPNQTKPNQTKPNQTKPNKIKQPTEDIKASAIRIVYIHNKMKTRTDDQDE